MKELHVAIQKACRHMPTLETPAIKMGPANTRHFAQVRSAAMFDNSAAQPAVRAKAVRSAVIVSTAVPLGVGAFSFRNHFSFPSPNSSRVEGSCKMLNRPLPGIFLATANWLSYRETRAAEP
jgi:hypothetical protein